MSEPRVKILVVEDEMIIGAKISMFLSELGYEVTGIIPRAEDVLLHLEEDAPDIALLDIHLKGKMDGIELAEILHVQHGIPVIFLTANADDATFNRAKATKPYAFLSKPFKKTDLQRAMELTISLMADKSAIGITAIKPEEEGTSYILSDRIFVRHKEKMVKIVLEAIQYIEADRNYCRIFTKTKEYLLTIPMKSLEDKLPAKQFQRIHRSYIVNLAHVDEVAENHVSIDAKTLPLSKSLREEFLRRIQIV